MSEIKFGVEFMNELEAETGSTRKCVERIPESLYQWKPHEKSMKLGDLTQLVCAIPLWIAVIIEKGVIDLATFDQGSPKTTGDMVKLMNDNFAKAKKVLGAVSNEELEEMFTLKTNGKELFTSSKKDNVIQAINHMVHHRGQLTVYMRLNDILVPSIYGPSADDKTF